MDHLKLRCLLLKPHIILLLKLLIHPLLVDSINKKLTFLHQDLEDQLHNYQFSNSNKIYMEADQEEVNSLQDKQEVGNQHKTWELH